MKQHMQVHQSIDVSVNDDMRFQSFLTELAKTSFDPDRVFSLCRNLSDNHLYPNPDGHLFENYGAYTITFSAAFLERFESLCLKYFNLTSSLGCSWCFSSSHTSIYDIVVGLRVDECQVKTFSLFIMRY
jgi:hypothetical protein